MAVGTIFYPVKIDYILVGINNYICNSKIMKKK
jgi:hypothetical protein